MLQAQAIEGDEAGGVILVIGFLLAAFHGGDVFVVEAVGRAASGIHDIAFVKLEADFAADGLLGLGNEGLNGLALGSEPEPVVNELGVFGNQAVSNVLGFPVDGEGFEVLMGGEENGAAGSFVDAA